MIRVLLLICLLAFSLAAENDIDRQIDETAGKLKHFDRNYASVNARMAETAKAILQKEQTVLQQQKEIGTLRETLRAKESDFEQAKTELQKLTGEQETLEQTQRQLRLEISDLLARTISLALMQDDNNTLAADAIISKEIFKALNEQTRNLIRKYSAEYEANRETLKTLTGRTAELRSDILAIEKQQKKLEEAKKSNEKALADLKKRKSGYKKEIKTLLAQTDELKETLSRLKIIQESKERQAKAEAQKARNEALLASKELPKVKSVGSSYHKASTRRYRGKKTIAPLEGYTVVKRYGTYTDPIYKIKIFNESVTLKPDAPDAKVKAVLNGKVILAQRTPMLENVVIIEHSDGLHTIYAHLDRIAPTVTKGKRLVKGSVIGRVNDELMFEVTQKNYHIDPLQLID